jgi:threonine/homoserine/homoserine lactone efflux protein
VSVLALTEVVGIAAVLGLFAGMAPGPYTTMVVATALERGFRPALPLAFAPLVTDLIPLAATVYLLTAMDDAVVSVMGVLGGLVVVAIGLRLLFRYRGRPDESRHDRERAPPTIRFWHVVSGTLLSPAPWLFWLGIASPILVGRWRTDWRLGAAFVVTIFAVNIASASTLAWTASHGRRVLAPYWRHRLLRVMALALVGAGLFLVVQGIAGGRMGVDPELVRRLLPGAGAGP